MADEKRREKSDPTVTSKSVSEGYQEDRGSHPIRPLAEQTYAAENVEYADNEDKPDPTTVAQVEVGPNKP
jgi:hypothetical protein